MIKTRTVCTTKARLARCIVAITALLATSSLVARPREKNGKFLPDLKTDQSIVYELHGRVQRHVKTESRVASILQPHETKLEFSGRLKLKIKKSKLENGRPVVRATAEFEYSNNEPKAPAAEKSIVEFTIDGSGQVKELAGLDNLDPLGRIAWQFWISRFAFGWTLPAGDLKHGAKWKSEEPENSPAPIARLTWERETTYGENAACPVFPAETCAVFYTSARLKQKSPAKDTTPDDYKLRELKTSGTANGTTESFATISQQTGLAVRGSEDVKQSMNVVIVKADQSNGVKYTIDAVSHFEMLLVPASAPPAP
jgi:hypothetical protein